MAGGPRSSRLSRGDSGADLHSLTIAALVALAGLGFGCSKRGLLTFAEPVSPEPTETLADSARAVRAQTHAALFGDTLVGFKPGSADSTRRFLGRLRDGYVADTLNVFILGDNRPGYKSKRLKPQAEAIKSMVSWNPIKWLHGLVSIPILLVRGTIPDLVLWRDIPALMKREPKFGREEAVVKAMMSHMDSLKSRNQMLAAIINTGDLVQDGRYPKQWERFLKIVRPLATQAPYFPIAGNHERIDSPEGLHNWHVATGLPVAGHRLYYSFDSADGWVHFVALDSNPMTDVKNYWTREVEVEYSKEQIDWLASTLKNRWGPSVVFLHHPPFSVGFHRREWQTDAMLQQRRADLVKILREAELSVVATGHEHAYERALLSCGDAVIVFLVAGGAGSPLHDDVVTDARAGAMYAQYQVEDCEFKPENVFASLSFHFIHMRFWYGGGQVHTYAVDAEGKTQLIDEVEINCQRFGVPKIDQFKIPIPPETGPTQMPPAEETKNQNGKKDMAGKPDSTATSRPLLEKVPQEKPARGKKS